MNRNIERPDLAQLRARVVHAENSQSYVDACEFQEQLVHVLERELSCSAGELGDAFLKLASLSFQCGYFKAAQMNVAKAIGYRRMYFGKGHANVMKAVDLAKLIQAELAKTEPPRRRRARALTF